MRLRRWESWVVYERAGVRLKERPVRRHFTRRAAERFAESTTNSPEVLARTIESASTGAMIFVNGEARRANGDGEAG
jgi:hypothetical protein